MRRSMALLIGGFSGRMVASISIACRASATDSDDSGPAPSAVSWSMNSFACGSSGITPPCADETSVLAAAPQRVKPAKAALSGSGEADWELVGRAKGEADDVRVGVRLEAQVGQPIEQGVERHARFEEGQVGPGAEVLTETEGEVVVVLAVQVELLGAI